MDKRRRRIIQTSPPGKYDELRRALAGCGEESVTLSFDELDRIVGGGLPWTARRRASWWSNRQSEATCRSHARAWCAAGYVVERVDLRGRVATFRRVLPPERGAPPPGLPVRTQPS